MDPELFKQQLEQFAELKQMKTPKSAAIREAEEPETIYRGGNEFTVEVNRNPTISWGIKKMKPHIAVCEDCHKVVEDRVVEIKRYEFPDTHWRKNCKPCGMVQNPYTKKFDLSVKQSFHVHASCLKGLPQPCLADEEKKPHLKPVYKKPTK